MPFKRNAARRRRIARARCRVTNRPAYEAGLRRRGGFAIWFTGDAIEGWRAAPRTTRIGRHRSSGGAADHIAEGDHVFGRRVGGGTHTGPAISDSLIGALQPATGRTMRLTAPTVFRIADGKIARKSALATV